MTRTFTARGIKFRTATTRRFIVIAVRTEDSTFEGRDCWGEPVTRTIKAGVEIIKRSDSIATARTHRDRTGRIAGAAVVVFDTAHGEEV